VTQKERVLNKCTPNTGEKTTIQEGRSVIMLRWSNEQHSFQYRPKIHRCISQGSCFWFVLSIIHLFVNLPTHYFTH